MNAPPQLVIRQMREEDVADAVALAAVLPEAPHWPPSVYIEAIAGACQRLALVAETLVAETQKAKVDRQVAGFAVAGLMLPEAELEAIAVARKEQGRGVGYALLMGILEACHRAGAEMVFLEVRETNAAGLALYRKAQFSETGRRRAYYQSPMEEAILMSRRLP